MTRNGLRFNPPPGWPKPPANWTPPLGWTPDPSWPPAPSGWLLWVDSSSSSESEPAPVAAAIEAHAPIVDGSAARLEQLEAENAALRARLKVPPIFDQPVDALDDDSVLQDVGIYRYHHPLENAVAYRERLDQLSLRMATMVRSGLAIEKSNMFTFNGSLAKGRSLSSDLAKLMLRAYNAESENVIRTLRAGNTVVALKRLNGARDAIVKLGAIMELRISDKFHSLRVEEIELTADYQMKKEEERETARAERERLREERKVEMELAAARERLQKERSHLVTVLERLRVSGEANLDLERKLADVDAAITQNDFRAANIRAGYVYVISNRGAFGQHVVKIGLTRRLEPLERIQELGDASVPFRFDVHAIYFSEDAVKLEAELHEHFAKRRMNWANDRKEFFFATPADVRDVLAAKVGNLLEFVETAESVEYLQSIRYWPRQLYEPSHLIEA